MHCITLHSSTQERNEGDDRLIMAALEEVARAQNQQKGVAHHRQSSAA